MFEQEFQEAQKAIKNVREGFKDHSAASSSRVIEEALKSNEKAEVAIEQAMRNLNLEEADIATVEANKNEMKRNLVTLINNLDTLTNGFGEQFSEMKEETLGEKVFGIFSKTKAREMRAERIGNASIEDSLKEMIRQTNHIMVILAEDRKVLEQQLERGRVNLNETIELRKDAVAKEQEYAANVNELDPKIIDLREQIANTTDPVVRTTLQGQMNELQTEQDKYIDLQRQELVKSQTLERYVEMNKNSIETLQEQLTNQKVMIEKLRTDTAQRTVLYEQVEKSLKVAEQQEVSHQINQIGEQTDQNVMEQMTINKAQSQNRMIDTLEAHKGNMQNIDNINRQSKEANDAFASRFGDVIEETRAANYQ